MAAGFRVVGIDIKDHGYHPSHPDYAFEKMDLADFDAQAFCNQHGVPVCVCLSAPCTEFSKAKLYAYGTCNEMKGLDLVHTAWKIVSELRRRQGARYWILENVAGLAAFIGPPRQVVPYNYHPSGKKAYLWGEFPSLMLDIRDSKKRTDRYGNSDIRRAEIPYNLAYNLAVAIKQELLEPPEPPT